MKKLSEIGTPCNDGDETGPEGTFFLHDERRELVEQAISAWEGYRWRAALKEMSETREEMLAQFWTEQGL
jgi:hypothetical protein